MPLRVELGTPLLSRTCHQKVVDLNHNEQGCEVHDLGNNVGFFSISREHLPEGSTQSHISHDLSQDVGVSLEITNFLGVDQELCFVDALRLSLSQEEHEEHKNQSQGDVLA